MVLDGSWIRLTLSFHLVLNVLEQKPIIVLRQCPLEMDRTPYFLEAIKNLCSLVISHRTQTNDLEVWSENSHQTSSGGR